jgi:hypothetical protein
MNTTEKHLAAIRAGTVTKSNVIGIRKAFNAFERERAGYSGSMTAPRMTADTYSAIEQALERGPFPRVAGELHDSGLKVLRNPRYAKRWNERQARIIAGLDHFELARFDWLDGTHCVPVYRAVASDGEAFAFRNVAWQSGGDGPEIV